MALLNQIGVVTSLNLRSIPQRAAMSIASVMAVALTISTWAIYACGGVATVDPPTLQLEDGPSAPPIESVLNDLGRVFCIC